MKRFLTVFLVIVMIFSLSAVSILAEEPQATGTEPEATDQVAGTDADTIDNNDISDNSPSDDQGDGSDEKPESANDQEKEEPAKDETPAPAKGGTDKGVDSTTNPEPAKDSAPANDLENGSKGPTDTEPASGEQEDTGVDSEEKLAELINTANSAEGTGAVEINLSGDFTVLNAYAINSGKSVVINGEGYKMTFANGAGFEVQGNLTVNGANDNVAAIDASALTGGDAIFTVTNNGSLKLNYVKATGGRAVCTDSENASADIAKCEFDRCTSDGPGGAVAVNKGDAEISDTVFKDCEAEGVSGLGGAVYCGADESSAVTMEDVTIKDCSASKGAGVAFLGKGILTLKSKIVINDLYIDNSETSANPYITVGALSTGSEIGISLKETSSVEPFEGNVFTNGYSVKNTETTPETIFNSNDEDYVVRGITNEADNTAEARLVPACTVTFKMNTEGMNDVTQIFGYGDELVVPEADRPDGQIITGWFTDADFAEPFETEGKTVTGDLVLFAQWSVETADLTITQTTSFLSPGQSALYHVTGIEDSNRDIDIDIIINGRGSKTIKDLPVGQYLVTTDTGWLWRYSTDGEKAVTVETGSNDVVFGSTLDYWFWYTGEAFRSFFG